MTATGDYKDLLAQGKAGNLYALGALPSPIDTRDHVLAPRAVQVPASYTHPAVGKVPVRNQQGSTCVGNSIATAMSLMEYAETSKVIPFSGELINARCVGKTSGEGAAMFPRDGLQDVLDHGSAAFMGDQGIALFFPKAYAAVDHTDVNAVKAALSTPGTVITAACWLLSNMGAGGGKTYAPDIPGQQPDGYHELTFVGYDDNGVLFQNSWGHAWGDNGFGRFAWDYVVARVGEMWAVTDNADTTGGRVNAWYAPTEPNTGRAVRKGTSQAVYLLESGGRIWVQSLAQAKQMGIDMSKIQSLPPTDKVWNTPVIGPDAPVQYQ